MAKQKVIVVVGPTASGKTSLAITIALQFHGEVISADSRQVYRKLDIGTAKVTAAETQGIPHHLIDIVNINTTYTAADFKRDARQKIAEIGARHHVPIIAGGTFFYVDATLGRIEPAQVSPNPELRAELETKSNEELFELLDRKDPRRASVIDRQNKRRLVRALEIVEQLGEVPPPTTADLPYDTLMIGIQTDPDDLRLRLQKRAEGWLSSGFIEEVKDLLASGISRERLTEIGFEYMIGVDLIDGKLTEDKFIEVFVQKNWQYAKRQITWLKRDPTINWVSPADRSEVEILISNFLTH